MARALLYIGGVNRGSSDAGASLLRGIAAFDVDLHTGIASSLGVTGGTDNPTFLVVAPNGRFLAAVSEVSGWNEGLVTAYEVDRATGSLTYVNTQPTRGSSTCHVGFDRTGRHIGVANYGGQQGRPNRSFAIFPIDQHDAIGAPTAQATHKGNGPARGRQDRPHAHCIRWSVDNRFFLVADLGIDQLVIYRFDDSTGTAVEHGKGSAPSGSGPRHFLFHPTLPLLYCVGELDSSLVTMRFDADAGVLDTIMSVSTLPGDGQTGSTASAIAISADARHLYVGNRGHDSIARFSLDDSGNATMLGTTPSGGQTPRDLAFDPSGTVLAVTNQKSDLVTLFRYRKESGDLDVLRSFPFECPTVAAFHPICFEGPMTASTKIGRPGVRATTDAGDASK